MMARSAANGSACDTGVTPPVPGTPLQVLRVTPRYRKVLEGLELREKLGIERLVGEEVAVEVTEDELRGLAASLGLSEEEVEALKSGGTVEALSVPYAGACTEWDDPPTWWDQYPYPKYSWEGYKDYPGGEYYYCTADPINLVWYRGDGYGFTNLDPIEDQFVYADWTYALGTTNYVYDPIYGWEPQQDSKGKDYPGPECFLGGDYDRYHVRLWKVHKWGYGRVDVVGQAHIDTCSHVAVNFEEAESEAIKAFKYPTYGYWNWYVEGEVVWLGNYDEGGDGWATRIRYEG